jgi:hypothetical protein
MTRIRISYKCVENLKPKIAYNQNTPLITYGENARIWGFVVRIARFTHHNLGDKNFVV